MTIISDQKTGVTPETGKRAEYIKGLRALADAMEQHPELPIPWQGGQYMPMTFHFLHARDARAEMAAARRALGVPMDKKPREDGYFDLAGMLHGLHVTLNAYRKDVCERVVVATREVEIEEPDPQAVPALPKVKRTEVVEDVEWICGPILAGEQDGPVAS